MTADETAEPDAAPEIPERRCPECGGSPGEVAHTLSALGYLHDDQAHVCADCGHRYTSGVPRGVADRHYWKDLVCASCGRLGRVHRVVPQSSAGPVGLHMKCPNRYPFKCPTCDREVSPLADLVGVAEDTHPEQDEVVFACPHCHAPLKRDDLNGCYYFWTVQRIVGGGGTALVGWPTTTGAVNPDRPYGTVDGAIRPGEAAQEQDPPDT